MDKKILVLVRRAESALKMYRGGLLLERKGRARAIEGMLKTASALSAAKAACPAHQAFHTLLQKSRVLRSISKNDRPALIAIGENADTLAKARTFLEANEAISSPRRVAASLVPFSQAETTQIRPVFASATTVLTVRTTRETRPIYAPVRVDREPAKVITLRASHPSPVHALPAPQREAAEPEERVEVAVPPMKPWEVALTVRRIVRASAGPILSLKDVADQVDFPTSPEICGAIDWLRRLADQLRAAAEREDAELVS